MCDCWCCSRAPAVAQGHTIAYKARTVSTNGQRGAYQGREVEHEADVVRVRPQYEVLARMQCVPGVVLGAASDQTEEDRLENDRIQREIRMGLADPGQTGREVRRCAGRERGQHHWVLPLPLDGHRGQHAGRALFRDFGHCQ